MPLTTNTPTKPEIKAIDPETGKTMWEFPLTQGSLTSGVLATAGGRVVDIVTRIDLVQYWQQLRGQA